MTNGAPATRTSVVGRGPPVLGAAGRSTDRVALGAQHSGISRPRSPWRERRMDLGPVCGHVHDGPAAVRRRGEELLRTGAEERIRVVGVLALGVGVVDDQLQTPVRT